MFKEEIDISEKLVVLMLLGWRRDTLIKGVLDGKIVDWESQRSVRDFKYISTYTFLKMYSFPGLNIAVLIGISGVVRMRSDILPVSSMIVALIKFVFDNDKVVLLLVLLSLYCGVNKSESWDKRIAITLIRFRLNSWMLENISLSL